MNMDTRKEKAMIKFDYSFLSEERKAALAKMMADNTAALATCQAGEECYKDSQDWLDTEVCANEAKLARIEEIAAEVKANADAFVLVGVGGSNNAARSVIEAIGDPSCPEIIYAGNTLNPDALKKMLKSLEGKSVYIDVIAKNFATLEPGSSFRILRQFLEKQYGKDANKRIICTGSFGSSFEKLCQDEGYTFIDFPTNVGGRYTAMTNVGLLPMAVAGIDIRALVKGAHDMQVELHENDAETNKAYQYACLRNVYYNEGYRVEVLSTFEPQLRWFYKWWMQLFAESEGKDNKGIFPVTCEFSEELHSVGQYIQDGAPIMFETFMRLMNQEASLVVEPSDKADDFDYLDNKDFWEINNVALDATIKAHSQKLPVEVIEFDQIDAYHFGQIFYFFQFACYLSCTIMGVNAFDQPGVEAYKKWMFEGLKK